MTKVTKEQLLEELKQKKNSCTLEDAENALRGWSFIPGRTKGSVRVWNYNRVTITLHVPHGKSGKTMDPGAVAMVIRKIAEAAIAQKQEGKADVN